MASGMRCAETTSASNGTLNSRNASPAAPITGQSESEPITIPTRGRDVSSGIGISHQVPGSMARPLSCLLKIISAGGDMAHLATGADLLAIELDTEPTVPGEAVQQRGSKIIHAAAEDVGHDRP